jgi:hypothetical protein
MFLFLILFLSFSRFITVDEPSSSKAFRLLCPCFVTCVFFFAVVVNDNDRRLFFFPLSFVLVL